MDFDDEGCPSLALQVFFKRIAGGIWPPFVLCVTDGCGLNLKVKGRVNLGKFYRVGPDMLQVSNRELYESFTDFVQHHMALITEEAGYTAERLSLYRGSHGNVVYGCWLVKPLSEGSAEGPA